MVAALGPHDGVVCDADMYRFEVVDGVRVPTARAPLAHELSYALLRHPPCRWMPLHMCGVTTSADSGLHVVRW
jgi:hypothetical protein